MAQAQAEFSELVGEETFAHITRVPLRCFCYQATLAKLSVAATLSSFSLVPGSKRPRVKLAAS